MHPNHEHMTRAAEDPEAALRAAARGRAPVRRARPSRCERYAEARARPGHRHRRHRRARPRPAARRRDRDRPRDAGRVYETPGHAPSHVCLFQPERRLLISGDHLLGRVSLYYDYGYTPDPAGEFLRSLDVVEQLDARLCLPGHGRTFTDVQAHIEANRALVARAHRARARRRRRARPDHRVRRRPARLRRADHAAERELVAERDALLPHAPRGHGRAAREPESPARARSAGASAARLSRPCASTRSSAAATSRSSPSSSSRRRREGERNLYARAGRARPLEPAFVSVTYGAGGSTRDKTIEIVQRIKEEYGLEAMAHFTCVGATVDELRDDARRDARRRASTTCSRCAATRRRARRSGRKTEGGLEYSRELVELIRDDYAVRDRRGVLPRDAHPRDLARGRPALPQGEGRRRRRVPDHAAVLRQRAATSTSSTRARAIGIDVPIIPGIMPITNVAQIERITRAVRRDDPRRACARELDARARRRRRRSLDFGVAYATLQCAELLRRRRARASTSTR